ncbi:hypothetical protein Bbelb_008010 [Branchiostoma belcheri]|nr:hypothetical protein Bbelb_008010 [Branchiostoma belcheri]
MGSVSDTILNELQSIPDSKTLGGPETCVRRGESPSRRRTTSQVSAGSPVAVPGPVRNRYLPVTSRRTLPCDCSVSSYDNQGQIRYNKRGNCSPIPRIRAAAARGILTSLPAARGGNLAFQAHISRLRTRSIRQPDVVSADGVPTAPPDRTTPHVPPDQPQLPSPPRRYTAPGSASGAAISPRRRRSNDQLDWSP